MSTTALSRGTATSSSRDKIMDVAERLMAHHGYAGTSIAMICAESDLPVGSVYHHFGSKLGLLHAVLLRGRDRLRAELPSPDGAAAPQDRIVDHYRGVARVAAEHLMFLRIEVALLLQSGDDPTVRAILAELDAGRLAQTVGPLTGIAADAGMANPEHVGRWIAATTIWLGRGGASQLGMTPALLRSAVEECGELMGDVVVRRRGSVERAARHHRAPHPAPSSRPAGAISSAARDRGTRERFLDAADRLMLGSGYAATSVADLCAEAGLPVGSLYHHFGSKRGLLRASLDRGTARFVGALPPIDSYPGSPRQRLRRYYEDAAVAVTENLVFFRILIALRMQGREDPEIRGWMEQIRAAAVETVCRALERVAAEAGAPDPAEVGRRLVDLSLILTDGAMCRLEPDVEHLRTAFGDIADLLWSAIDRHVASARDTV